MAGDWYTTVAESDNEMPAWPLKGSQPWGQTFQSYIPRFRNRDLSSEIKQAHSKRNAPVLFTNPVEHEQIP